MTMNDRMDVEINWYYNIAVIIIDFIYTRSYFERVFYLLDVTCQNKWLIDWLILGFHFFKDNKNMTWSFLGKYERVSTHVSWKIPLYQNYKR